LPSVLPEQLPQLRACPVHGSVGEPHSSAPHVAGVQQVPPAPHVVPPLHVTVLPHESVLVPHSFAVQPLTQVHSLFTHSCPCPPSWLQLPVPQLTVSPHAFLSVPHLPAHAGGSGGVGHAAQLSVPPQPSLTPVPHTLGLEHVRGVQHWSVIVLHFAGDVHVTGVGHVTVTPQPVRVAAQLAAQSAAVGGVHATHWCVVASQTSGLVHAPQFTSTPHESVS
jgi:hypothetical protein